MAHTWRLVCFSLLLSLLAIQSGHSEELAPTYQRGRGHQQMDRGWRQPGGYPIYPGYFGFPPQVYGGSWYQRPYPTHLDYFRLRSNPSPTPPDDCPCATDDSL